MAKKTKQYTGCMRSVDKARDFARESFVYGLKGKNDHKEICDRTYDETTRQMQDWFNECLHTRIVNVRSKIKYLSLSCRDYNENPLYRIWKACTFTSNEITFFFFILDYLTAKKEPVGLSEIHREFRNTMKWEMFSESAAQKWMDNKGYPSGIFIKSEDDKYSLAPTIDLSDKKDLIHYYSEIAPGGVIGSFILDKLDNSEPVFSFKQHYIGQAFESDYICMVLNAIKEERYINIRYIGKGKQERSVDVIPIKVYSSTQNGRQYLIARERDYKSFSNFRLDKIKDVVVLEKSAEEFNDTRKRFEEKQKHLWGVSFGRNQISHVEFVVRAEENEGYILRRLLREKRCGTVTTVENQPYHFRFEADVYDPREMFPWIRTFIGRIVEYSFSDNEYEKLFRDSMSNMFSIYGVEDDCYGD